MGKCIIFCAADFHGLAAPLEKEDYIIAADGGLNHTNNLGITPNGILGDFDSLGYMPEGSLVFPVEKDDTDAMLAIRKGLELGYREFYLYGSLDGPRLDHTVANFQALQFLCDHGAWVTVFAVHLNAQLFQVEQDVDDVFPHVGQSAEFMHGAFNAHSRYRSTFHTGK